MECDRLTPSSQSLLPLHAEIQVLKQHHQENGCFPKHIVQPRSLLFAAIMLHNVSSRIQTCYCMRRICHSGATSKMRLNMSSLKLRWFTLIDLKNFPTISQILKKQVSDKMRPGKSETSNSEKKNYETSHKVKENPIAPYTIAKKSKPQTLRRLRFLKEHA